MNTPDEQPKTRAHALHQVMPCNHLSPFHDILSKTAVLIWRRLGRLEAAGGGGTPSAPDTPENIEYAPGSVVRRVKGLHLALCSDGNSNRQQKRTRCSGRIGPRNDTCSGHQMGLASHQNSGAVPIPPNAITAPVST